MRILHTSDWHLGHTLHEVDRVFEHRMFLDWVVEQIRERGVDALLIAGDVFDTANPSAAAQDLWFHFLAQALRARPGLQIVAIAGNHDSGARLEAPDHLLRQFDIRVIGSLPRRADGSFDPVGVVVPLKEAEGRVQACVIAMPFLRMGDLPLMEGEDPLVEGVATLYRQALEAARPLGVPILAMGHCYMVDGRTSELSERKVLGGNQHALPASLFPEDLAYIALGHLHLPQTLGGDRIRYSGSPIPLAMSERHYPHSVTLLEVGGDGPLTQETLRIPRGVDLLRVPARDHLPLEALVEALRQLPDCRSEPRPFLEVAVRLEKPEGTLRATLDEALEGKGYFLAKITPQYTGSGLALGDLPQAQGLRELTVEEVFQRKWSRDYPGEPSPEHLAAFHEVVELVHQETAR